MKAFYSNSLESFLSDDTDRIVGILTQKSGIAGFYQQTHTQTFSWRNEIEILKSSIKHISTQIKISPDDGLLLEYPIPRRGKRIDAILIIAGSIIIIEYKSGKDVFENLDAEQLTDYCLDLRDFHKLSKGKEIIPVLLTSSLAQKKVETSVSQSIAPMLYANADTLGALITDIIVSKQTEVPINYLVWENSNYEPTPTIIEAAQTLYAGKSVEEISRSHAGTKNLNRTSNAVIDAINYAKGNNKKIICFITGVPGAGKTLAGLNIAHHPDLQNEDGALATFLSGNAPLIKVLREALSRDSYSRKKDSIDTTRKKEHDRVIAFIENVHRFIDEYFADSDKIPNNKVVIFDEAQRAWNAEQSKRKFDRDYSEPEMMFEIMQRHKDWSVIVALIGGGQEINTGEAGLREWGNNIIDKFSDWEIFISPELKMGNHSTGNLTLFESIPKNIVLRENKDLHLEVSIRAYKAEQLSHWVSLVLSNNANNASQILNEHLSEYKIAITRELNTAKSWLKNNCLGTRRMGLVASSGGRRLIAEGLDVKSELDAGNWFLNPKNDVRSSYYLEVPATEFSIQGLELDWVGVCWDLDLRRNESDWDIKAFKGTKWQNVNSQEKQTYVLNKYRVLLTRAREGMIIWVPKGYEDDITRQPREYDMIYEYLKSCGVPEI